MPLIGCVRGGEAGRGLSLVYVYDYDLDIPGMGTIKGNGRKKGNDVRVKGCCTSGTTSGRVPHQAPDCDRPFR